MAMERTDRLGCGVYADGRVEIGGPTGDLEQGPTTAYIATNIDAWRKTNAKVEELARLAGV